MYDPRPLLYQLLRHFHYRGYYSCMSQDVLRAALYIELHWHEGIGKLLYSPVPLLTMHFKIGERHHIYNRPAGRIYNK